MNHPQELIDKYSILLTHFNSHKKLKETLFNKLIAMCFIDPKLYPEEIIAMKKFYKDIFRILNTYTNTELVDTLSNDESSYNSTEIINNLKICLIKNYQIDISHEFWKPIIEEIVIFCPYIRNISSKVLLVEKLLKLIFYYEFQPFGLSLISVAHCFNIVTNRTVKRSELVNTCKRHVLLSEVDEVIDHFIKYNIIEIVDREDTRSIYYKINNRELIERYAKGYDYWDIGGMII
jgi:hypothetical protein